VKGDEIPRAEMNRVRARSADVDAAVLRSRLDVEAARVTLARAMGLSVPEIENAPLAADPLPAPDPVIPEGALASAPLQQMALDTRADVRSSHVRVASAEVLLAGARVDLKPVLDLSVMAGINAIWEDPHFNIMSAFNPTGTARAFGQPWIGPSAQVGLKFALPFGNHAAKGKVVQLGAIREQADLQTRDLERQVKLNVLDAAGGVRTAAAELASRYVSSEKGLETIRATLDMFQAGEASALDSVRTEQYVTQSALDGLAARLTYVTRVARLRYEAGALLPYSPSGSDVSFGEAAPLGFEFKRRP